MKQTDIDLTEAVEELAIWLRLADGGLLPWASLTDDHRRPWRSRAQSLLRFVAPHIERQVREQVAREIEAFEPDDRALVHVPDWREAMEDAARIARGEQP